MAIRCQARDLLTVTKREITPQGYLVAPAVIGRCGIQSYLRGELGIDGDPNAVVRLMRTPEEVFRPETIASFESKPLTYRHPEAGVDSSNWLELSKGHVRDISKQPADLLGGTVWVMDREQVQRVVSGDVDLSCGYSFDLDLTPGRTDDGQEFDGFQRNILGDHLAILDRTEDSPRGGPICRIGDKQKKGKTMAMKKLAVDGLARFEIEEIAAESIEAKFKEVTTARDAAISDLAEHVTTSKKKIADKDKVIAEKDKALAAKDKEIGTLKADLAKAKAIDVDALVTEKSQVITDAKKLAPELECKGTPMQIRKAALAVAAGDATNKKVIDTFVGPDIEKASDEKVKTAFEYLAGLDRNALVMAQDRAVAAAAAGNNSQVVTSGGEVYGDDDGAESAA